MLLNQISTHWKAIRTAYLNAIGSNQSRDDGQKTSSNSSSISPGIREPTAMDSNTDVKAQINNKKKQKVNVT